MFRLSGTSSRLEAAVHSLARGAVAALLLVLPAVPVSGQGEALAAILPTELSVGLGAAIERHPGQSSSDFNVGLARPPSVGFEAHRDQWVEPAIEMGLGPTSDEALCQDTGERSRPDTCVDWYLLLGPRFRPLREADRPYRPFVHFLIGGYWPGTGLKDPETLPGKTAIQIGGGVDLRKPTSIHGLRVSGDYRRVFAGDGGRRQVQLVLSYFLGWRGNP